MKIINIIIIIDVMDIKGHYRHCGSMEKERKERFLEGRRAFPYLSMPFPSK
jgi:hypothetical protein